MDDILKDLLLNGFMIYPSDGKYIVKKEAVPNNTLTIKELKYNSYDLAFDAAVLLLNSPKVVNWSIIIRYNQGLGIEYKNFPDVQASNKEDAELLAKDLVDKFIVGSKAIVSEIRVRVKN